MSLLRRIGACTAVTGARLRSQPLQPALLLFGTALAFAMLVAVLGGSLVARQQALARALAELPESGRGFRLDRFGLPLDPRAYDAADREARRAMAALGGGRPRRVVVFRELRVQGELVEIAAADDLAGLVRVRSGRLPRTCADSGCEVIQIGGGGAARLREGEVRLRRVGVGVLRDPALFGDVSAAAVGAANPPKLLLARDVRALQRLGSLQPFYRIYSWVAPLRLEGLHTWDIGRVLAAESRAQSALAADPTFRLSGPDAALLDAQSRGRIAARRLLLVGSETSALLLGFALIAAIGLRRGLGSERRRLLARGARRWQAALVTCAEIASITFAGAVVGVAGGSAIAAAIARAAEVPAGAVLGHAITTRGTLLALLAAWVATTLVLVLTTFTRDAGERRGVQLIDVAAAGAAATIGVAAGRGALDPSTASSQDTVLFLLLPALVCFVVAAVLARLLAPAMRAAERVTRRSSISLRLAVLALARAPSRTVVSCAFVAVALGLALFAASYRATLDRGAADQATFEVPLDFVAAEGRRLVRPLDAAPLDRFERVAPGARAYPILRLSATTAGSGASVLSPTVLGVPAAAISRLRWRSDFSRLSPQAIAHRVAPGGAPHPALLTLPAGTRRVTFTARLRGADLEVGLVTEDPGGAVRLLPLGGLHKGADSLSTKLDGTSRVLGLQLALPTTEQFFLAHRESEGAVAAAPSGVLELGPLIAETAGDRRRVTDWRRWTLPEGGRTTRHGARMRLAFAFQDTGGRLVFRPEQPVDHRSMPVVVSPEIARVAGTDDEITLDFQDVRVPARIVGVADRMPTVPAASGSFVLADGDWLRTALDVNAPGRGTPNEVWVSADDDEAAAAALRRPPFDGLQVSSRAAIEHRLATDPLAHATAVALGGAAVVALALALLGFWVGVVGELRDERSDFFDLEAQGLPPDRLRTQLRMRAGILVAVGLAGGAGLGALLSQLVVSLVRISATTAVPEPPLRFDPAWLTAGLAVLALATIALLLAEATSLAAFRGERPERASWGLE